MPKKNDILVYKPFPWKVLNGNVEECHVVIREQPGEPTVHVLAEKPTGQMQPITYFHKDELDSIIAALKAAQTYLESH